MENNYLFIQPDRMDRLADLPYGSKSERRSRIEAGREEVSQKRILVICPHPENVAPGQRFKYEQYFDYFRSNQFQITVSPFMTRALWNIVYQHGHIAQKVFWTCIGYLRRIIDVFRLPFYDGIYIFLWVTPFGTSAFERIFRLLSKRVIYDIDDLVFLAPSSEANPLVSILKGKSKIIYLGRTADHVITCTPYLDSFVRRFNSRTTDISSTINTDLYIPKAHYANDHLLTLGWSGSHSTAKYLYLLKEVLLDLTRELRFRLLVIGNPSFRIDGINIQAIPWDLLTEIQDLQQINIGLYPLPDELWAQGKSGLKAIQYMALGIPTVASAVGANFRVIEDSVSGFLVRTHEEWKDRIRMLAKDPDLRSRIGLNARSRVEKYFSVKANRDKYLKILKDVYS